MEKKLVSVVIPVYNAADTLKRCVDSVKRQTYEYWELILVDDGSKDKSRKLCDELAKSDQRIRVIHQQNKGASEARNEGIRCAKGNFLAFIDADDYVSNDYLKNLCLQSADYVVSGMRDMPNGNVIVLKQGYYQGEDVGMILSHEINSILFKSPWGKLYSMKLIRHMGLFFDSHVTFGEDSLFNLLYLTQCRSIACVASVDYMYFVPSTLSKYSITHEQYRYILHHKTAVFNRLKSERGVDHKAYLAQEFHDLTTRLFIGELQKKYTLKGRKDFIYTFHSCHEKQYIDGNRGGRLYAFVIHLIKTGHCFVAFVFLRFVYPLSLLGTKRAI